MTKTTQFRLMRLTVLLLCLMTLTSLMAQDTPVETPADIPTEVTEVVSTEPPTEAPTEIPATEVPATEAPLTEAPATEAPVVTATEPTSLPVETEAPTTAPVDTEATVAAPPAAILPPEPTLDLVIRELFEDAHGQGVMPAGWVLPVGWSLSSTSDGSALLINTPLAGVESHITLSGVYHNAAVMGYFTFVEQSGAAQLVVRESAAGAYVATLDALGQVTLEKRDGSGASSILGAVQIPVQAGARGLRLSAIDGVLRVSVDNVDLIAVADTLPLPAGTISIQAQAPATILFDNFFLWQLASEISVTVAPPTDEVATVAPTAAQPTEEKVTPVASPSAPTGGLPMATLAAPALTGPANNAMVQTLRPTFTWAVASGANRYHLRVATENTCTTPVDPAFDVIVATTSFPAPIKLPQGEYWYCVESQNITTGAVSGFIGEKRHFIVDIAKTPANGAVVVLPVGTTTTPFTWATNTVVSYGLQIDDDANFASPSTNMSVPGLGFSPNGITYGVLYWRVNDGTAELPIHLAHKVTVTPPLPVASAIQTPAPIPSGGSTNDTTPKLDWTVPANWVTPPAGQSITYELDLATNTTFTALVAPTVTNLVNSDYEWTNTTLPDTPGTVYYWRVRAKTNLGLYGAYSATFSFKLDTVAPLAPATLTTPANNVVSSSARPGFSWAASTGAIGYLLDLSSAADFNPLGYGSPFSTTSATLTLGTSLPQNTAPLYWRVRAKDAAGNISAPSVSRTLTIDYGVAPANNTVKALTTPTATVPMGFSWTGIAGLTGPVYTVSIFTDSGLNTQLHSSGLIATPIWTSPALAAGEYWWVLSVTGMGTSAPRRFVVSPPLPKSG